MYILVGIATFPAGENGEWVALAIFNIGQGAFTTGHAKACKKECYQHFFSSSNFSYLGEEFCTRHPKCSRETHPQEKQLLTGILFICFWGPWPKHCVPSGFLKSRGEPKSSAMSVHHGLTLMVFLFSTFRSWQEQWNVVCILESVSCWWNNLHGQDAGAFLLASFQRATLTPGSL